jgi:Na+/H+ antiporter NhaD/arsenite permease-like protein
VAVSVGAVFFGAATYLGNGPNFMVKAIAGQHGVPMPSFGGFVLKYSLPFLLPGLLAIGLLFFRG